MALQYRFTDNFLRFRSRRFLASSSLSLRWHSSSHPRFLFRRTEDVPFSSIHRFTFPPWLLHADFWFRISDPDHNPTARPQAPILFPVGDYSFQRDYLSYFTCIPCSRCLPLAAASSSSGSQTRNIIPPKGLGPQFSSPLGILTSIRNSYVIHSMELLRGVKSQKI